MVAERYDSKLVIREHLNMYRAMMTGDDNC
jgi:hypothetical protein